MRKIIYLLVVTLLVSMLAACGTSEKANKGNEIQTAPGEQQETPTEAPTEAPVGLNLPLHNSDTFTAGLNIIAAVRNDGTVACYERETYKFFTVKGWQDMVAVEAENPFLLGLRSDGTVATAELSDGGYWHYAELDWTDIVAICSGYSFAFGLRSDGTVAVEYVNEGWVSDFAVSIPSGYTPDQWTDIVDICYGDFLEDHMLVGLQSDGTVVLSGSEKFVKYRLDQVPYWENIIDVECSSFFLVGLKADGTVVMDGSNAPYDLSDWTDVVDIAANTGFVLGLKADGTVLCAGDCWFADQLESWTDIIAICVGDDTAMGMKRDGTLMVAGYDNVINNDWSNVRMPG